MKRSIFIFSALMISLMTSVVHAEWYNELTFIVGSNVTTPITVSYHGKEYKVYSSLVIKTTGSLWSVSAKDNNGKTLKYDYKSKTVQKGDDAYHYNTYTFYPPTTYGSSSRSSDGGGYSSGSGSGGYSGAYESGAAAGRALGAALFGLGGGADGKAYPSLQIAPGISRSYGEFFKVRYTGYGFHAYGSVGKDWLFDSEYKNKILWNVGIGSYFAFGDDYDPNMDVAVGLSVGQQAQWEKLSLMIDVDYTYWIGRWRRVGVFAGGGIGWGSFAETFDTDTSGMGGFAWNLEAGIVFRLANF